MQLPRVFDRADARRLGIGRGTAQGLIARGEWRRLRRGRYCLAPTWEAADPVARHLLLARAVQGTWRRGELVVSHLSAALAWGLPSPLGDAWDVWCTDPATDVGSTRYRPALRVEVAPIEALERRERDGLVVTSPGRTVADCLRHLDALDAVPIADAAVRAGLTSGAAVRHVLEVQAGWPYAERGGAAASLVDGVRESWLESASAVVFARLGLPEPEWQLDVLDARGRFLGRVDAAWRERGVVGEADGRTKYAARLAELERSMPAERAVAVVLREEKSREDALRTAGLEVVRWSTAALLGSPRRLQDDVLAAFARGEQRRFSGTFRRSRRSAA